MVYRGRLEMSVAKVANTFGDSPCWPKLLASFAILLANMRNRQRHNDLRFHGVFPIGIVISN
jgi:hypothetical protein